MSYHSAFAACYDRLTGEIDYRLRARYFDQLIRQRISVTPETILLDLACGTGSLSAELSSLGYDVIGVDGSAEMLSEAVSKNSDGKVLYLCQPMDRLDLYGTIDAAVCALDSLNHITDAGTLERVVGKVSLFTAPGGVFVFDVNTPYKHREVLGNNTFVYDLDDIYCVWQNTTGENLVTEISLDIFQREGDAYFREEERFCERAYPHEQICGILDRCGFTLAAVYAGDTLEPVRQDTQRAVYVALKR